MSSGKYTVYPSDSLPRTPSNASEMEEKGGPVVYERYKRRFWYVAVVVVLNLSNAMTWICFAPISFHTNAYYKMDMAATLFNVIFMVASIPFGFLSVFFVDRYGLRGGCYAGAVLNLIGNIVRCIASADFVPVNARFGVAFTGQTIAAIAQPLIMYLPTKLTGFWFPDSQRVIADVCTTMANPLGIAAQYLISPQIITNDTPNNFLVLTGVTTGTAILAAIMAATVTSSEPPTPASGSKATRIPSPPFCSSLGVAFCNFQFMVLAICLGGGVGLFNALYNNLQPALCTKGYSDQYSGYMGALLIVSGLGGAVVSGVLADWKKHRTEEIMKISFCTAAVGACSLCVAINYPNNQWWISLSIAMFGFFGFAVYPLGLETGVEILFPVAEATSTGLIMMMGQIQGIIYVAATGFANQKVSAEDLAIQTCASHTSEIGAVADWKISFIVWTACVFVLVAACTIFFKPTLNRLKHDQANIALKAESTKNFLEEQ